MSRNLHNVIFRNIYETFRIVIKKILEKRIDHNVVYHVFFINQGLLVQLNLEYGKGL